MIEKAYTSMDLQFRVSFVLFQSENLQIWALNSSYDIGYGALVMCRPLVAAIAAVIYCSYSTKKTAVQWVAHEV